jgi:hypothetical protein
MSDMQFDKSSGAPVSPFFDRTRHGPANTGVISAHPGNGPSGGEIAREKLAGNLTKPSKVADSTVGRPR